MNSDRQQRDDFQVFLSYRREDAQGRAYRLYDHLLAGIDDQPGFADVFMDIDTLEPGVDFRVAISEAVGACDVLLAIIGKRWVDAEDAHGDRRLDNTTDHVRLEIEAALDRQIPVVPILVDGAAMPAEADLPVSLSALAYRNAVELSDTRWRHDVGRVITWLRTIEQRDIEPAPRTPTQQAIEAGQATRRQSEDHRAPEYSAPDRVAAVHLFLVRGRRVIGTLLLVLGVFAIATILGFYDLGYEGDWAFAAVFALVLIAWLATKWDPRGRD